MENNPKLRATTDERALLEFGIDALQSAHGLPVDEAGLTAKQQRAPLQQEPHLRLHYIVNGERHYDYWVELEPVASNLPGASSSCRYDMVCPQTGRRATVLYLRSGAGIFAHREAFPASSACSMIPNWCLSGSGA